MNASRDTELKRRLERLIIVGRLKAAAFWCGLVIGIFVIVSVLDPDVRALLRNDRLGPPVEISGIVVGIYVPEMGPNLPYRPPVPIVKLENGRRLRIRNPYRITLLKGDRVIVEERTYMKSDEKKYRIIRLGSDD